MRTIAEIEADIKVAAEERRAIDARLTALRAEKNDTFLAGSGLVGHIVSYTKGYRGATTTFLVEGVSRWGGSNLRGRVVKKDGSLGVREVDCPADLLTDHGLYEAKP